MKLVQNGKAVFRFRKLAAMPFGFTAEAFGQALPIVLVGSLLFVLPGLFGSSVGQFDTSPLAGFLIMLVMGGVFACQAAVFSLTLTIAMRRLLPDGESGALSRLADMKALVEKVWPQFFGMLTGLVTFSFLFAFVTAMPFQSAFEKLASTGDPASALLTFIGHILLEAINPWFWLFGAFAAYYFRTAAKRAIVAFESVLDALDLRVEGAPSLTYTVDANRKLFASLVSVPHFLFGLAFAVLTSLMGAGGISGLIKSASDFSDGALYPLAASLGFNLMLATLFSLVAGFIAVIWLAAAQSAGIVNNLIVAEAGFGSAAVKLQPLAGSRPAAAPRPLAGSGPVVRRSRLGL